LFEPSDLDKISLIPTSSSTGLTAPPAISPVPSLAGFNKILDALNSTYMNLLNVFIHMKRVITRIEHGVVRVQRRVTVVQEIEEFGKYRTIAVWDPRSDKFRVNLEESIHLRDIADKRGLELEDIIDEIYRKATVLNWMLYKNILNVWDVSRIIFNYYYDPATVYKRAVRELEEAGREVVAPAAAAPEEVASTEELVGGTKEMGEATKELFERTRELGK
jgi:flagellar protein FlaI